MPSVSELIKPGDLLHAVYDLNTIDSLLSIARLGLLPAVHVGSNGQESLFPEAVSMVMFADFSIPEKRFKLAADSLSVLHGQGGRYPYFSLLIDRGKLVADPVRGPKLRAVGELFRIAPDLFNAGAEFGESRHILGIPFEELPLSFTNEVQAQGLEPSEGITPEFMTAMVGGDHLLPDILRRLSASANPFTQALLGLPKISVSYRGDLSMFGN